MEEPNRVGLFANLCWDDVNNGCGHATYNAGAWLEHFEARHQNRKDYLIGLLSVAYKDYVLSLPRN